LQVVVAPVLCVLLDADVESLLMAAVTAADVAADDLAYGYVLACQLLLQGLQCGLKVGIRRQQSRHRKSCQSALRRRPMLFVSVLKRCTNTLCLLLPPLLLLLLISCHAVQDCLVPRAAAPQAADILSPEGCAV
jgi:hypothetical protein